MTATDAGSIDADVLGGDYYPDCWLNQARETCGAVCGIADTHAHPMAHLAFGGRALWGTPDGPVEEALGPCTPAHGWGGLSIAGVADGVGRHRGGGYPTFRAWPTFDGRSHQQMYVEWIRRAHRGGLRLMVGFAVNNEVLAWATRGRRPYDDAAAVETQVGWMTSFADRHRDLLEIAFSPADARRIIADGRLAVVIGVEVDSLIESGRGRAGADGTEAWLEHLYRLGVRHVFPLHLVDNDIGGAALYHPLFAVLNRWLRGRPFEVRVQRGIDFRHERSLCLRVLGGGRLLSGAELPPGHGHGNARGLSDLGRSVVLPALMRLGMVIDIDHMSRRSADDTLELAEARGYPLVAGHAAFRDLALSAGSTRDSIKLANEYQRTADDVRRLTRLGGLVGVGWVQRDVATYQGRLVHVDNDSAGSAKSWAQAYLYAVEHSEGRAVGLGTDTHGLTGAPGPRFGPRASSGLEGDRLRARLRDKQRAAQRHGVRYHPPTVTAVPLREHRPLAMCVTGHRGFDINVDGVAQYGMLPDFLQDLRNVGMTSDALTPLFRSAEGYIAMWERIYKTP